MSYIVKNCPAFVLMRTATSGTYFDMCGNTKGHIKCADCTDCVMKQIVELCKETCRKRCTNDCLGTKKHCGYGQILKHLDIQEVE